MSNAASAFFGIADGGEYPCGNNIGGDTTTGYPKCFIRNGDNLKMGVPTIITMTDFTYTYTGGANIKARILFYNPDQVNRWVSVYVKAFSGTSNQGSVFGNQYVGHWNFFNIFNTET